MAYQVTFIPGDGTGPEIADATKRVLDATGVAFEWDVQEAGVDIMETAGTPLPDSVIESIKKNKIAIKGPITTPVGTGFRSVNVALRKAIDLYACVRPCKSYKGVRSRYEDIDLVFIRENTEDLYAGIEFEKDTPEELRIKEEIERLLPGVKINDHSGISIKPISVEGTRRIVQYAFDYAREYGRKKVTAVHKANIMKYTDGLFLAVATEVAEQNSDIEFEERIVDNMCMQLVQKPELYDVLVLPNLYGDILSDLGAGLVGGLGVAPGANIGTHAALVRADARQRAEVRRPEQGQPDGHDVLRCHDAPVPQGDRGRRPPRERDGGGDHGRQGRHLRYEAQPGRPDRRRDERRRRRPHQEAPGLTFPARRPKRRP